MASFTNVLELLAYKPASLISTLPSKTLFCPLLPCLLLLLLTGFDASALLSINPLSLTVLVLYLRSCI